MEAVAKGPRDLGSAHWSADEPVVKFPVRSPPHGLAVSTFGDGIWNLHALTSRSNVIDANCVINFENLFPDPVRHLTARELVMQRLNRPVLPTRKKARLKRSKPLTVYQATYHLSLLYRFMDLKGVRFLRELTQSDLDAFVLWLRVGDERAPSYVSTIISVTVWLHEARGLLTKDWIEFLPWKGKSIFRAVGARPRDENETPRIPEEAMQPLMQWAVLYVERFADDIIRANDAKDEIIASRHGPKVGRSSTTTVRQRLEDYVNGLRERGEGVPSNSNRPPGPHMESIRHAAGIGEKTTRNRDIIDAAVAELGLSPGGIMTPVSVMTETGMPWREQFSFGDDIQEECRHLTAACYVVIDYLSGMRDSEAQETEAGCVSVSRGKDGVVLRHYLNSIQHKGEEIPKSRKWVIIEPVVRAINVLTRLTASARNRFGTKKLFIKLAHARKSPSLKALPNGYIENFIRHVNEVLEPRLQELHIGSIPPLPDGRRITTRMFRRTLAWHIANRPFGTVAGMIQYGHLCERLFEGYAGKSESGFRQEVEAERAFARQADVLEIYDDWKRGVEPAGPMAGELVVEFDNVRKQAADFPGQIVDPRRLTRLLEHLVTRLYPTMLAHCFFQPGDAVCLSQVPVGERREPLIDFCNPDCSNACWTKRHRSVWEKQRQEVQCQLRRNRISPLERDVLVRAEKRYAHFINAIEDGRDAA